MTTNDCSLIHDLASRIWESTYGKILSKEQLDYMFDMMYAPDSTLKQVGGLYHQYSIILTDDTPTGYLSIGRTGESTYNFQKIYPLSEMHGMGAGRFIIEQDTDCLKEVRTGSSTIKLYINRYSPAIGFYRHMGLREIGTRDRHIGNDYFMSDYIMGMEVENK